MKLPSKQWLIAQIKKNFWKRVSWLSIWAIVGLLIDEKAKEGYILNLTDVTNPLAHEFWIVVFLLISIVSYAIHKLKGGGKRGA